MRRGPPAGLKLPLGGEVCSMMLMVAEFTFEVNILVRLLATRIMWVRS